jgi:hypothetical protein
MSILLPFEVLTVDGWKAAGALKEQEMVACVHQKRGLEYRKIRQLLLYTSNFLFTPYSNGIFSVSICKGHSPVVPFPEQPQVDSRFLQACRPVETEAYDPEPKLFLSGELVDIDGMQLQAISEGVCAVVEHVLPTKVRIQTEEASLFWPQNPVYAREQLALSVSCYEKEPTHLVLRLSVLAECYKTMCIIV